MDYLAVSTWGLWTVSNPYESTEDTATLTNVKRSLDYYVKNNLYTTEGISIDYEGLPFDEKNISEWIQPRFVDAFSIYTRQGSNTQYAEDVNVLYQINIFVKKSGTTITDRHYGLRDKIIPYFKTGQKIAINNWTGDTGVIDYLTIRELTNDSALPEKQETYQYMLSFEMDFTRLTTKPT